MRNNLTNYLGSTQAAGLPVEVVTPPQPLIDNPTTWLRDGNSAAEIITALAVLLGSITGLVKVLLPLLLKKQRTKIK